MAERAQITITGVVQGVGFRPYVYSLATALGIGGHVTNTANGVLIEAEGGRLAEFLDRLPKEAPPLSRISTVHVAYLPADGSAFFKILPSINTEKAFTLLSPDVSICPDCLRELMSPQDRRHLYPFINCTNCGPRYSITLRVPYDRPNTTMAPFAMCPACEKEYRDPLDRRFHAQPNACLVCGPQVEFRFASHPGPLPMEEGTKVRGDALKACVEHLRDGGIVAIKGLGGFHIACDAANDEAVRRLRDRKRRSNKPFAVMAPSIDEIRSFCEVNDQEQHQLESHARPIVLLRKKQGPSAPLSEAVSPKNNSIGCMLPYTPMHYLLFHRQNTSEMAELRALVMTSGNLSEEPIVRDNEEAIQKLSGIVDAFLLHNRDIFMRVDDTVMRVRSAECGVRNILITEHGTRNTEIMFLRRSRGYAPEPICLSDDGPEVMGCGADLKNTFTLTKGAYAIPSQHIGDMENYETLLFYEEALNNLKQVYRVKPVALVHDLHPGYLSTQWAMGQVRRAECGVRNEITSYAIQHHYAHIGSVMAEHGLNGPVIGVAFDGTGYGTDGNLWGGEFLIAGIDDFERVGHFKYIPLPGGEAAIREPWRTAVSLVSAAVGADSSAVFDKIGFFARYGKESIDQVLKITGIREVSPLSSGAGRLFDAVAALIGICDRNTFEGEAAIALESLVREGIDEQYPVVFREENTYTIVDFGATIKMIINDLNGGIDRSLIAARFHNTILFAITSMVKRLQQKTGIKDAALSGGTFQNRYLAARSQESLVAEGMNVYLNRAMPPNDACISLGQAYLVRERLKKYGQ
ncbi:MAG: carbamoyltransferase HypF [Nitrospirota bacterium]|nr:carbamoyltransferase HypF [Nitrospirota bacterium]